MAFYDGLTPTIYAAPTDQGSGDGSSEANAMDLPTAMVNATAGDIVGLVPGVYTAVNNNTRWTPAFKFTNSGTSGNPIILVGKYDHIAYYADTVNRCEFRTSGYSALGTASSNCAVLGADQNQNYLQFRNIFVDSVYVPPRAAGGSLVASGGSTGIRFRRCVVKLTEEVATPSDNYNAIFAEDTTDLIIDNCYFYGGYGLSANRNWSAITTYYCHNFLFENNTVENANSGIFIKGLMIDPPYTGSTGTLRYNKILDVSDDGITMLGVEPGTGVTAYQNLIVRAASFGIRVHGGLNSNYSYQNHVMHHNTLVDCGVGLGMGDFTNVQASNEFRDNVVALTTSSSNKMYTTDGTNVTAAGFFATMDYNLYSESGVSAQWSQGASTYTGIADWRTGSSRDTNATEEAPGFTNTATDDYTRMGSDTGSSTGGRRGCYITNTETIGASVLETSVAGYQPPILFVG
jgi:hypothetical protein